MADAGSYFTYAYNLKYNDVYSDSTLSLENSNQTVIPNAVRPPGYPLFLVPFLSDLPINIVLKNIYLAQALISIMCIFFSYLIFRIFLSLPCSLAGSLLVALSPHLIVCNSYILTETLFCFFVIVFTLLIISFYNKPSLFLAFITGVIIGLASLVRSSLQFFPIFLLFFLVFNYKFKKGVYFFILLLLGMVVCLSPWIVRNLNTLGKPADNRQTVNFLHHGIYPDFIFDKKVETFGFPYLYDPRSSEISKDVGSAIKEIGRRFKEDFIAQANWYIFKKPFYFWQWDIVQGFGDIYIYPVKTSPFFGNKIFIWSHQVMRILHWPFTVLCAFGCILAWFPFPTHIHSSKSLLISRFISILLIYYTVIHMVGAPFPRYSIPLRPFLYGMALFQIQSLFYLFKAHFNKQKQDMPN
ncbi:glycosyltransferase family 39 protein [Thermodesulfobacteriota bacterium]